MKRSTFFKSLFVGIAAAPAVAKVIAETEQKPVDFSIFHVGSPVSESHGPWFSPDKGWALYENGVWYTLDQRPLRFTA